MDAVAAAHQRAVNIEQVGCLGIPGEPLLDRDTVLLGGWSGQHDVGLAPPASAPDLSLAIALAEGAKHRTFATHRTLEFGANFRKIKAKLGHGTAQRIAVHTKFFSCLALVPPVRHQNFA